jgi:L-2-hydroxyglutarate oxidase
MYRFCMDRGIPHQKTGKVVVALHELELPQLDLLEHRGRANGLRNLRRLNISELRDHEPHVAGIAGLYVEETGIVSYKRVSQEYAQEVRRNGGQVHVEAKLQRVIFRPDALVLHTTRGEIECRLLINCAGLQSDRVARMCGMDPEVRIVPFRGEYYRLKPAAQYLVRNLIYPVPNPAFPFLGVHFTRMIEGGVEAGPNAVLALSRHGYAWRNFNPRDIASTISYSGFWKMAWRYWRTGFGEIHRSLSKRAFCKALSRIMPGLMLDQLEPGGAGVRAQAVNRHGALVDDFVIQRANRMVHVLNAPSPAATASISIGRHIAQIASTLADFPKHTSGAKLDR